MFFRALSAMVIPLFAAGACIPDVEPTEGVVVGGQFNRLNDARYPATVADFQLDRFEATVGRFRQFVAGYPATKPKAGAGAHPLIEGSGWDPAWDASLPAGQDELRASLQCDANFRTWTDEPAGNEAAPINCVSWYLAFAFCAWDEGRLPTEAEWNYAAVGGNEHRAYPWGDEVPSQDLAVFGCDSTTTVCPIPSVGSKSPAGDGKWGHADLAGSLFEWVLDYHADLTATCTNCAALTDGGFGRGSRGGAFSHTEETLSPTYRIGELPERTLSFYGFRCARGE
ncbi:formylglycine-generating enzyme family protein [Sorangium sp. So ce117]|uniref:formylglycine-generating enzyme family protein n=1 Tax=Sorangium sp. So ce117 TaxID=3133277 RepID=UPI003F5FB0BB